MNDMKSKLPDLKELTSMTSKLFNDIKTSVGQIIRDYKHNRTQSGTNDEHSEVKPDVKPKNKPTSKE